MEKSILIKDAGEYNKNLAEALKALPEFEEPEWASMVKTSPAKKRPTDEPDFWQKRAASMLRQIYKGEIVGVNRFRTKYGSKKNRGMRPEKFKRAGGKIIRTILQQADRAGFTEIINARGVKAGRKLTEKGKKFLEGIDVKEKEEVKNA
jgi:small subunit ribosomal protein S19e